MKIKTKGLRHAEQLAAVNHALSKAEISEWPVEYLKDLFETLRERMAAIAYIRAERRAKIGYAAKWKIK